MHRKDTGDGDSVSQKRPPPSMPDTIRTKKNSVTHITSDTTTDKGGTDKNMKISNKNLVPKKSQEGQCNGYT